MKATRLMRAGAAIFESHHGLITGADLSHHVAYLQTACRFQPVMQHCHTCALLSVRSQLQL
jgi:hypothetical protein